MGSETLRQAQDKLRRSNPESDANQIYKEPSFASLHQTID